MVNKKESWEKKAAKTSKSSSAVTKKTAAKPAAKKETKAAAKAPAEKKVAAPKKAAPIKASASELPPHLQEIFKDYYQKDGRIYLTTPRSYGELPDLLELQKKWYDDFVNVYLGKLFADVENIWDIAWEKMYVTISDLQVSEPIESVDICRKKELTYGGIITAKVKLVERVEDEKTKKVSEKVLFNKRANIWILPLMTPSASYIINWVERVIISQIIRSYGIFYGKKDFWYSFKLIPENGPWLEVNVEKTGNIVARINKSRKFPITSLLRVFGLETDESIREVFKDTLEEEDVDFIDITLKKDPTIDALTAAEHIYGKLRPGELIDQQSALDYVKGQFLLPERIYVGNIARRKINAKLNLNKPLKAPESNVFDWEDIIESVKYLVNLCNHKKWYYTDDSDHLSNKRVRTMGEILYAHLQPVMRKFVKSVRGKLSVLNMENPLKITDLVNFKMIDNSIKSFFATSQLSQFLDQINPLSEVEHKRRITALGPGGLKRETAKFEVRDVHPSHYGRICPIETPEWQNIGLVIYQSLYSRINAEGFLETPALKIFREANPTVEDLTGRIAHRDIYELDAKGNPTKKVIIKEDQVIDEKTAASIVKFYGKLKKPIAVKPYFTGEVEYISPEMDEKVVIADATTPIDEHNNILSDRVAARHFSEMETFHVNDITHMDVNLSQIFSPNTSLIPFVDHNDSVRASVATNQQRQAQPLLKNDAPLVGTWLEGDIVKMTHAVIKAEWDGEVIYVDGGSVKVKYKEWIKEYKLQTFVRSNSKTCITQVPVAQLGQKVKKGDLLAEGPCSVNGEMALWKSLRVAYMPWKWYNYEDAIIISQRLVKDDELTSIVISEYEIEVAETKLGPEETTNDIPGVSMSKLGNLDEEGIIRIGSIVKWWDLLIGKITPKGEWELTPEEKLIQAIFGDKSKNVKDTSLYMPSGSEGKVVDVVILDSKKGDNLMAGVRKKIKVYVASTRKIEVWDKLAGKHGNKGIVAIVVPEENMPYSADGRPVDVVLNSLWVISRMNLWQLFESQLWLIAHELGVKFAVPTFWGFGVDDLVALAKKTGLEDKLRTTLYDWETWEPYAEKVTVWYMHMLKLIHMVEDKIHARSVGPYSLITQQPLWGKSRQGWQRFWEMEVWALEAYSAVYTLQEMLTVKSDDVIGRNKLYEAIIKSQKPKIGGLPESFNLLTYLFKGLGQNITALTADELEQIHEERVEKIKSLGLSGIMTASLEQEMWIVSDENDESEDKGEMIGKVVEDLEDFGQIE